MQGREIGHAQLRKIDSIFGNIEIGDRIAAEILGQFDVILARTGRQRIVTRPTGQGIDAIPTNQHVITVIAGNMIIEVRTDDVFNHLQDIIACPTGCRALRKIDGYRIGRIGIADGISTIAALDMIIAKTAAQEVVTRTALQNVIAGTANQKVAAFATLQNVVFGAAIKAVIAFTALQDIRASTSIKGVVAKAALQHIVTKTTIHDVIAATALQGVIPGSPAKEIITIGAMDNVVPRCRGVVIDIGIVAGLISAVGSTTPGIATSLITGLIPGFDIRLAGGLTIRLLARCAVATFSTRVNRVCFAIGGFAAGRILAVAFIRASIFTNSLFTGRVTGKTGFIRTGFRRCFCPGLKAAIGVFLFGLALSGWLFFAVRAVITITRCRRIFIQNVFARTIRTAQAVVCGTFTRVRFVAFCVRTGFSRGCFLIRCGFSVGDLI